MLSFLAFDWNEDRVATAGACDQPSQTIADNHDTILTFCVLIFCIFKFQKLHASTLIEIPVRNDIAECMTRRML